MFVGNRNRCRVISSARKKNCAGFIAASRAPPWLLSGCAGVFPARREILGGEQLDSVWERI
jgi:hypothetical protein